MAGYWPEFRHKILRPNVKRNLSAVFDVGNPAPRVAKPISDKERRLPSMALPTVLIVEDDVDLRQTLAESLEASGFAAAQAVDATDAIDRLKHFAYDAMVID